MNDLVLVHLGHCNKIPETGCLIKNRNLFFTVPEAGMFMSKVLAGLVSGEGLLSASKLVL